MAGIAVLVTDASAQGIKPILKTVSKEGLKKRLKILLFFDGFKGLMDWTPISVKSSDFEVIIEKGLFGGTGLEVQDTERKQWIEIGSKLLSLEVSNLIVLGGVDGIESALKFNDFFNTKDNKTHLKLVSIPVTIEWFSGTDTTIGVDSALNSIISSIESLTTNESKHQKIVIIELKGQNRSHLALRVAIALQATDAIIEGQDMSIEWMTDLRRRLHSEKIDKKLISFIVVTNNPVNAMHIKDSIKHIFNYVEIKPIGDEDYGQFASAFDIIYGSRMAVKAIELLDAKSLKTPLVLTLNDFNVISKELKHCLNLNESRYQWIHQKGFANKQNKISTDFMGNHFKTLFCVFNILKYEIPKHRLQSNTFGITQTGRHTKCGNGSVFSFTKHCLSMSVKPITVSLGFKDLIKTNTNSNPISMSSVNDITKVSKSHLKSELIPLKLRADHMIAMNNIFKDRHLNGLVIIGGFMAQKMLEFIKHYSNIQIPMALIPSSLVDYIPNVYNLSTDTTLNETLNAFRNIVNTSLETNSVFIFQTNSNVFTEMTAELVSADHMYKETQTIADLKAIVKNDAKNLRKGMTTVIRNRVIVLNTKLNDMLRGSTIEQLYKEEGLLTTTAHKGLNIFTTHLIDCRELQASKPSALDRIYGIVLGIRAVRWLRTNNNMKTSRLATICFTEDKDI